MDTYLVDNYSIENISFGKPKKHGEYFISKVKYSENSRSMNTDLIIQFPKMKLVSELKNTPNVELEFIKNKYYKSVFDFLSKLEDNVMASIFKNSEEWFGKKIPLEKINTMYNKCLKAPRNSESECTMNFVLKKGVHIFVDNKQNDIEMDEFKINSTVECISKLKYILFLKDKCYPVWEFVVLKLHKKINKVPKYGFIEEEVENNNSDNEIDETDYSFFN